MKIGRIVVRSVPLLLHLNEHVGKVLYRRRKLRHKFLFQALIFSVTVI